MRYLFLFLALIFTTTPITAQTSLYHCCAPDPTGIPGKDGWAFETSEWDEPEVNVRFVWYRDIGKFRKAAEAAGARDTQPARLTKQPIVAFSIISKDHKTCTIHAIHPERMYSPELVGHEIVHCAFGRWHR